MPSAQDQPEEVIVRGGKFRISKGYDPSVRIPDEVLKCVGFIGEVTHKDGFDIYGDLHATGFFVSVPSAAHLDSYVYFVTAKHVAEDLKDSEIYFLVNKRGGGVMHLRPYGPWILHPADPTADVAIASVQTNPAADIMGIRVNDFASPNEFGVGDEVFATGLFTEAPGTTRNFPIVRHGNLAMIPDEQIQTDLGYADVYLVEARSIGGLSGSPVWVRPTLMMPMRRSVPISFPSDKIWKDQIFGRGGENIPTAIVGPGKLLGLAHGHWSIKESDINKPSIEQDRKRGVNYGIAIVVPASKITETINQSGLVEIRNELDEVMSKKSVPGMDSAKPRKENPERPFTKADFEAALRKVSRRKGE
jgi:hypothetical protein